MTLVVYIKEKPKFKKIPKVRTQEESASVRKRERFFFGFISVIGLSAVIFALLPSLVWQLKTLPRLKAKIDLKPVPEGQVLSTGTVLAANVQVIKDEDGFTYFFTDYQPPASTQGWGERKPQEFSLSIPKLKIVKAKAKVDSLRFDRQLSHFPGSAIPGEIGNSFITGHSVLPQFNDPKNYRAIFTKLSDLEIGDQVIVEIEGKTFNFIVQYAKIVDPKDLSVLGPISPSGRNLTLMTCVPPGTNTKRLVVITSLI